MRSIDGVRFGADAKSDEEEAEAAEAATLELEAEPDPDPEAEDALFEIKSSDSSERSTTGNADLAPLLALREADCAAEDEARFAPEWEVPGAPVLADDSILPPAAVAPPEGAAKLLLPAVLTAGNADAPLLAAAALAEPSFPKECVKGGKLLPPLASPISPKDKARALGDDNRVVDGSKPPRSDGSKPRSPKPGAPPPRCESLKKAASTGLPNSST